MFGFIANFCKFFKLLITFFTSGLFGNLVKFYFSSERSTASKNEIAGTLGKKLAKWLQNSGPSFIKLGQVLATRSDILGDDITKALATLQDKLPPFSFSYVEKSFAAANNRKISDIFLHFEQEPVAAASIAQVHKAVLKDDTVVAVKILRPNISRLFFNDLKLLYFIARTISYFSRDARRMRIIDAVKTLEEIVKNELDLRFEAACADKLAKNCAKDKYVKIPKVFWDITSEKILVIEWIDGIRIDNVKALEEAGHSTGEITKRLAVTFFNQAYRDGFFHGDLHPGNIFVTTDGKIALVDFGIMGFLSTKERKFIAHMLYAFLQKDYEKVAKLHFEIGYIPKDQDFHKFALACRSIGEPIIGLPTHKISAADLLRQLFKISQQFNIILQTRLILLQKTMLTVEGVGFAITPEVNMWKLAEPWIADWAKENFGIKSKLSNINKKIGSAIENAPEMLEKISNIIEKAENILEAMERKKKFRTK